MNAEQTWDRAVTLVTAWTKIKEYVDRKLPFLNEDTKLDVCEYMMQRLLENN